MNRWDDDAVGNLDRGFDRSVVNAACWTLRVLMQFSAENLSLEAKDIIAEWTFKRIAITTDYIEVSRLYLQGLGKRVSS